MTTLAGARATNAAAAQNWTDTTVSKALTYRSNTFICWFAVPALAPAPDNRHGTCDNQACDEHVILIGELGG